MTAQFHWLRPAWLLAIVPAIILCIFLWRIKKHAHQWQQLIAPELLPFLLDGKTVQTKKSLIWVLLLAWIISSIAIAGPSWTKRPTPVEKNQNALVILLDLSYSMISEDIKPSRIARARLKIADILRDRKDGQTALVAYAGEAHTVTPISDDSATIVSLLSSMHPTIMPLQGSNTEDAVARGIQLLHDAGATQGDLLLITDGVVPEAFDKIQSLLSGSKIRLNILGVGTTQPAPIPNINGGFLRDNAGAIITTQLNTAELSQLAQRVNGRYHEISNNNADIEYLKPLELKEEDKPKIQRDFDQWMDQGHWFVFLLLPIVLFCFRRGLLFSLLLIPILGFAPSQSYAFGLDDIWLTKNQQAQQQLKSGDAKSAAEKFDSSEWKAAAQYRAGDFAAAAESYSKIDTASGHYNRGNALAKLGKLEDAIKAYDEALKRDANMEDAKKNRELAEKLLKQQKEQQEKNKDDKNQDQQDQKNDKDKNGDKKDQQNQQDNKNSENNEENKQDSNSDSSKDQNDQNQNSSNQSSKDDQGNQKPNEQNAGDQQQSSSQSSASATANDQAEQSSSAANAAQAGQSSSASTSKQPSAAQASSANSSAGGDDEQQAQAAQLNQDNLTDEQKQAMEQWLRRVPDDPGGLLRNKFKYQYQLNRQKHAEGELKSPENNADQRL
ncbi:MAG: VWA domain-containing protein [Gammaproteobacteria bacterium]|nr:MAG: VWA domain-containing protein [Gammaproteobacteria bacterium]